MNPEEKIKKIIQESKITTTTQTQKNILKDTLEQMDEYKLRTSSTRVSLVRSIVKNPVTKYAAIFIVLCALALLFWPGKNSTLYAQQILDALEKKSLMHTDMQGHIENRNSRTERWYDYDSKIILSKYYKEDVCYKISSLNYKTMESVVYEPNSNRVEILYRRDVSADFWTDSPLSIVKEYIDDNKRDNGSMQVKKNKYEGKELDEYTFSISKDFRGDRVYKQLIVDSETHLPIMSKRRVWTSEGMLYIDITSTFEFPDEGPKDIYDLGVARDTEVVYNEKSKEFLDLKKKLLEEKAALKKQFDKSKVYYLEESQILKNISPSLISERLRIEQINKQIQNLESGNLPNSDDETVYYTMYYWDGSLIDGSRPVFREGVSLKEAFDRIILLSKFEYTIPQEFSDINIHGDWILRIGASKEQKLKEFEKIVQQYTGRNIRFVNKPTEREVIIATGTFKFTPLEGTYDDTWIHVFSDKLDPDERGGGGNRSTLGRFLRRLGDVPLNIQVIDETESSDDIVRGHGCHLSSYIYKIDDEQERARKLEILLDNLTLQTNLEFKLEHRKVDTWFIQEN